MFNFENLAVWHKAIAFSDAVYNVTRPFPREERFGLSDQMRRAAVSIASNIAEGSSRASRNDYARFLEIATGSVFEIAAQAAIAKRQSYITQTEYEQLYAQAEELSRMLSGLRKSLSAS